MTCADAEQAGFRPCKRCRPNEAPRAQREAGSRLSQGVPDHRAGGGAAGRWPIWRRAVGVSPYHFHRMFKNRRPDLTPEGLRLGASGTRDARRNWSAARRLLRPFMAQGTTRAARFYAQSHDRVLGMAPNGFSHAVEPECGDQIRGWHNATLGQILVAANVQRGVRDPAWR